VVVRGGGGAAVAAGGELASTVTATAAPFVELLFGVVRAQRRLGGPKYKGGWGGGGLAMGSGTSAR
jgi:hypothetical protein